MNNIYVVDLDGTLIQNNKFSEKEAKRMIDIQKDNTIIIATGRKENEAQNIIDFIELKNNNGKLILADGQYCIDYEDNVFYKSDFLNMNDVKQFYSLVRKYFSEIRVIAKSCDYLVFKSPFSIEYQKKKNYLKDEKASTLFLSSCNKINDIEKIVMWTRCDLPEQVLKKIKEYFEINFIFDKKRWEIKNKGVNKSSMLKMLVEKYNYDIGRIFVFGNDENDLCLFEHYKNSFVMNDSNEKVKLKANKIICDVLKEINMIEGEQL